MKLFLLRSVFVLLFYRSTRQPNQEIIIMKADYRTTNLRFQYPFTISKGTKTHQTAIVVSLENFGITGFGEAPAIPYYDVTVDKMVAVFSAKKMFIEKFAFTDPERFWHYLHHLLPVHPFLVCALDIAAWDMFGKMKRRPLYRFWSEDSDPTPLTDYTIGIDTPEKMVEKMNAHPWPIYKVKLGTADDIGIIEILRKNTDAIIRIDANAAWTVEDALQKIDAFKSLGVEFIEQPLAKDDWEGMKILMEKSPIPLIADESCVSEADVKKCEGHFHGINIKLTKCSGITPALRMIQEARKLDMRVMVGSMNESTIGSAAIAHLLPLVDFVDMDGPLLLAEDVATGLEYNAGKVSIPQGYGLGIETTLFN